MEVLIFILLIAALVCFLLAAANRWATRWNLVALGLACWALVLVIDRWPG